MERAKELKRVFKNWGVAKKQNARLTFLSKGFAVVRMKILKNDLTPHSEETRILFGGYHPMLANMAGAMAVYSMLEPQEEPLLTKALIDFTEPVILEEKEIIATARAAGIYKTDGQGKPRKTFEVSIEVANRERSLKAIITMHYAAKPTELRKQRVEKLRNDAKKFFKKIRR